MTTKLEYAKLDVPQENIIGWYTLRDDGDGELFTWVDGADTLSNNYPGHTLLIAENYLPLIPDPIPDPSTHKYDYDRDNSTIEVDHVSYDIIPKTQEELNNDISEPAKEVELETKKLDFLSVPYAYLTPAEGKAEVDNRLDLTETFASMPNNAAVIAKLDQMLIDLNWLHSKSVKNLIQLDEIHRLMFNEYKNVLDATVAPTVNDDITQGWSVGSLWRNVTPDPDVDYECLDSAEGAAVWVIVGQ